MSSIAYNTLHATKSTVPSSPDLQGPIKKVEGYLCQGNCILRTDSEKFERMCYVFPEVCMGKEEHRELNQSDILPSSPYMLGAVPYSITYCR
jgi:hypothetical protein